MQEALIATNGVIARAAERLGMPVRTFFDKQRLHGLTVPRKPGGALK